MIHSIHIHRLAKHLDRKFVFESGLTHITGENEAGKSLIFEAISFALFGVSTLRLPAKTYAKDTAVTLVFEVKGTVYSIKRGMSDAKLSQGELLISKGVSPVSKSVQKLLGFNADVFNIGNLCKQFDVTRMSSLLPTDRRKVIENVVGLSGIEKVLILKKKEVSALTSTLKGLNLNKPQMVPEPLEPYSEQLALQLNNELAETNQRIGQLNAEANNYKAALSKVKQEPTLPEPLKFEESSRELMVLHNEREVVKKEYRQYAAAEKPSIERSELTLLWEQWNLSQEKKRLVAMGGHTCEQCNHFTPLGGERLKELEKLPDSHYKPEITLKEWDSRNTSWLKGEKLKETFLAMKAAPPLAEIQEQSKLEEAHKNYASALATYLESKANLESFKFDSEQNQSSLVELHQRGKNLNLQIQTQSELKKAHESYNSYVAAKIKHDAMVVQIQEDTDAYKLEVEVLQELMDAIKSQLLPTINQVGSGMLSLMSEGLHTKLELTEDMQIMVDDEPVDALSGSGKSIAHLSLRLTLAQVLTTGMFPVFMVDEVDGSMSESRSAKVMEALTLMMRKTVKQLIVISHKTIESPDHLIVV